MAENKNLNSIRTRIKKRPSLKEAAKSVKISQSHFSNIIAGRRTASPETLKRIENALRRIGL